MSHNEHQNGLQHIDRVGLVDRGFDFSKLYNDYQPRLVASLASRLGRDAAEDISATAFARAFEKMDGFRGEASFYTWVHAIALNEARRQWRHAQVISAKRSDLNPGLRIDGDEPVRTLEQAEYAAHLRACLSALPKCYRRVLVAHFLHGLSIKPLLSKTFVYALGRGG